MLEKNLLIFGDNLAGLDLIPEKSVRLIYVDPPFNTGKIRSYKRIRLHVGEKVRTGFGGRQYAYTEGPSISYADIRTVDEYLNFLKIRLEKARQKLTDDGSIYVHIDYHSSHLVRLLLEEIFGAENFLSEIIWAYDYGGRPRNKWAPKHDTIYWFANNPEKWVFNRDEIDRLPYMAPSLVTPEKAEAGKLPTDTWWMTIVPTNGTERTGYPSQKPLKLLKRIIAASSSPGDFVMDFFCGSGTTGVAAEELGRRWILMDNNPEAIAVTEKRVGGLFYEKTILASQQAIPQV